MISELRWTFASGWFWAACLLFAAMFLVSLWNVYRRRWDYRHLLLEGLRLCLATTVCLLLAKPESWQTLLADDPTPILVLADQSASMGTEDMSLASGDKGSRRAWLGEQTAWKASLSKHVNLEWMGFESVHSGVTDLHSALMRANERGPDIGGIILFSDGDWNAGQAPPDAALALRRRGIPIIALPVGREVPLPDIALTWLPMPKTLVMDDPAHLPFHLENRLARPAEVEVTFKAGEETTETRTWVLGPGEDRRDAFLWKPSGEGEHTLTLTSPVLPDETREGNNADETRVTVRRDRVRALLVDSAPRWEFRYLRNALMRDPNVEVSCVLFHPGADMGLGRGPGYLGGFPASMEALTGYDVVFLGDVGVGQGQLTSGQAQWLRGLVERQASGLVFLPGRLGHQARLLDSALGELLPIVFDLRAPGRGIQAAQPSALELTELGRGSVLTLLGDHASESAAIWRSLPGFYWHAPVARSKPGASVLAVHQTSRNTYGRIPLLVTRPFGSGKVLFLGTDGAWRWRRGVEDLYHYRFWSQVARWMAYQRNLAESDRGRIIHYPDAPRAGREVAVHATLLGLDGGPLDGAHPTLTWKHAGGEQGVLALHEAEGGWGVYRGSWAPGKGGRYEVAVRVEGEDLVLRASIEVAPPPAETTGDPARPEVLRRLAESTNGKFLPANAIDSLPAFLESLAKPKPTVRRHQWWHHPAVLASLILGLSVFWAAGKRLGLI